MSSRSTGRRRKNEIVAAHTFAALGDPTRLVLVNQLADGTRRSIAQLSEGSSLTRQGITKHLRVLEDAGVVSSEKAGRETLYGLNPRPIHDAKSYIDVVSRQWDRAIDRLKAFVEDPTPSSSR